MSDETPGFDSAWDNVFSNAPRPEPETPPSHSYPDEECHAFIAVTGIPGELGDEVHRLIEAFADTLRVQLDKALGPVRLYGSAGAHVEVSPMMPTESGEGASGSNWMTDD